MMAEKRWGQENQNPKSQSELHSKFEVSLSYVRPQDNNRTNKTPSEDGERLNRESTWHGSTNMGVWTPRTQVKVDRVVYDLSASQEDEKQREESTEAHRQWWARGHTLSKVEGEDQEQRLSSDLHVSTMARPLLGHSCTQDHIYSHTQRYQK